MTTYEELDALLHHKATGAVMGSKKLKNNTYAVRIRGNLGIITPDLGITLHNTFVVIWRGPGWVRLGSGGWYTVTTKDRINTYTPAGVRVTSRKGKWFAQWPGGEMPFFDGIEFHNPKGGGWQPLIEGYTEKELQLDREDAHNASMRKFIDMAIAQITPDFEPMACPVCTHLPDIDKGLVTQHYVEHITMGQITGGMVMGGLARMGPAPYHHTYFSTDWGCARVRRHVRSHLQDHLLIGAVATKRGRRPV